MYNFTEFIKKFTWLEWVLRNFRQSPVLTHFYWDGKGSWNRYLMKVNSKRIS